jgi:hypothetical protein
MSNPTSTYDQAASSLCGFLFKNNFLSSKLLTITIIAPFTILLNSCVPYAIIAMNNAAGSGTAVQNSIPEGSKIYVKEKDIDHLGWHSKIENMLSADGYKVIKKSGAPDTYSLFYDYNASWDVFHYTLKSCDFVCKKAGQDSPIAKAHFQHFSPMNESSLLKSDFGKVLKALRTGVTENENLNKVKKNQSR